MELLKAHNLSKNQRRMRQRFGASAGSGDARDASAGSGGAWDASVGSWDGWDANWTRQGGWQWEEPSAGPAASSSAGPGVDQVDAPWDVTPQPANDPGGTPPPASDSDSEPTSGGEGRSAMPTHPPLQDPWAPLPYHLYRPPPPYPPGSNTDPDRPWAREKAKAREKANELRTQAAAPVDAPCKATSSNALEEQRSAMLTIALEAALGARRTEGIPPRAALGAPRATSIALDSAAAAAAAASVLTDLNWTLQSVSSWPSDRPPLPETSLDVRIHEGSARTRAKTTEPKKKSHDSGTASDSAPEFPMPSRPVPVVLEGKHELTRPELDVDWTLAEGNWDLELQRREQRNKMIKDQLRAGKNVMYRSSGRSLEPLIYSNDCTTWQPVASADEVKVGDIVFCQVFPSRSFYGHLVFDKWKHEAIWYFRISNHQTFAQGYGPTNGWTDIDHIYGKLIEVWR